MKFVREDILLKEQMFVCSQTVKDVAELVEIEVSGSEGTLNLDGKNAQT